MAIIANNIVIGKVEKVKNETTKPQKPTMKSVLANIEEIRKTAHEPKKELKVETKQEKIIRKKDPVIIEKRAKLSDSKSDRKSAYVRDMTTI